MEWQPIDYFIEFFSNAESSEEYLNDCFSFLVSEADKKGIEFDGYFRERWENSADTIIHFDEDYFDNMDRKKLFVYLSCLYDNSMFQMLSIALKTANLPTLSETDIKAKIESLIKSGIKF